MSDQHDTNGGSGEDEHGHAHPRNELPRYGKRAYAIRDLLVEKGIVSLDDIQRQIDATESRSPANGAHVVARAWIDPAFKGRLLEDAKAACAELGYDASSMNEFEVVENTESVRHLVVCTLCSCYPRPLLGRPPDWYKSLNYRRRAVNEPREVMREFGHQVPDEAEVRVLDSSADIRYMVIPVRPAGTEGWSEEELARLVTRDSLVGAGAPLQPSRV
jgi:nitrile hydratase